MNKRQNKIFIISGPSGAGEDSVIDGLKKRIKFNRVVTTITRQKRPIERQGKPYYFITVKKFKELIKKNQFVEWAIVYGDYRGCTKKEIDRLMREKLPILWKVDWQGVKTIKKFLPQVIAIFIAPPSYEILEKRLIQRGQDSLQTIKKRGEFTKKWLKHKDVYNYLVVNKEDELAETINKIEKIIKKELKS